MPKLPPEYEGLDKQIAAILTDGVENAPPTSGNYTQPVQMWDLDGDGQEEAIAFFRNPADEKPLKIHIFTARDQTYEQTAVIEGSGTGVYSIAYSDMDQDGRMELLVGWRVSADLQALSVYALGRNGPEELVRTNYVKYAVIDLNQDQLMELVVLRSDDEGNGVAAYYDWRDGGLAPVELMRVSTTMAELSQQGRVTRGTLQDSVPALFITGVDESSKSITDVLTLRKGELSNIVLSNATGVSGEISHFHNLYPMDINGDGVTEVPRLVELPARDGATEDACQRVDWNQFHTDGTTTRALSTYHDMADGWYLKLPDAWMDNVLVSRSAGSDEATVTFSAQGDTPETSRAFLKIYTLTGSGREMRAGRGNRFSLRRQSSTIYAAEFFDGEGTGQYSVSEEELQSAFSLITPDWGAGDN